MSTLSSSPWMEEISASIEWLRTRLAGGESRPPVWPTPMRRLAETFGLTDFESAVLMLSAALELDGAMASEWGPLTFSLALEKLPGAHWDALTPEAPLRRWGFLCPEENRPLTQAFLRLDETILHYILGCPSLDSRLVRLLAMDPRTPITSTSQRRAVDEVMTAWRSHSYAAQLLGPDTSSAGAIAAEAATTLNLEIWRLTESLDDPRDRHNFIWLWNRHAAMFGSALLIEGEHPWIGQLADRLQCPLALVARERLQGLRARGVAIEIPNLSESETLELWQSKVDLPVEDLYAVATQFRLSPPQIADAASMAADTGSLWDAARNLNRGKLEELAQRIETRASWPELVVTPDSGKLLQDIVLHVRHSRKVYSQWGFRERHARGLGITALFSGQSGTGKTLAAEVIANELGLDLYRIDLSRVVSKYIGETEKNLRQIFDAAERGGAVLLFDEADALFGKRSEVKDSHDRYANIEVSYLLQRMEQYRGLAILTTNLKGSFDTAFLRRIRFVISFAFPDADLRKQIWERIFPAETPTSGLDPERLSRLNVAGGNIKNIALFAAFLAADDGGPVTMRHIREAAKAEYAKLERPLTDAEVRGWC